MSTIDQPAHAGARRLRATLALAACLALCVIASAPARADPIAPAAAGNVPGAALLLTSDAWLGAAAADAYDLALQLAMGGAAQGGIAGYSITTDGSDPDDTVEAPAAASHPFKATYRLPPLPEGAVTVRALTISKHGDRAATITSALLRVDRTPPDFPPVTPLDPATWFYVDEMGLCRLERHDQYAVNTGPRFVLRLVVCHAASPLQ